MQHVDEGTIHAWLDEQITDPAEAARIEAHLRDCAECRALLAEEQATFEGARALLDGTAPPVERPSFEALVAKAGRDVPDAVAEPARRRERLVRLSWAASLALAVGLGWTARELTNDDETTPTAAPTAEVRPSPERGAAVGNTVPFAPAPVATPVAPPAHAAAPAALAREPRQLANADARRSEPRSQAAPAAPAEESAAPAPLSETIALAPQPIPAGQAAARVAAAPPPAPSAAAVTTLPSVADSRLEAVTVADGQWRAVPRTEAAARTGMPLYGIDGLEPQYTGLSADGTVVRTLYRLESGQQVELVQQRGGPAPPPMADAQSTLLPLAPGRTGAIAQRQSTTPPALTIVRGDVRLTLQTSSGAADLAALGLRLRVD